MKYCFKVALNFIKLINDELVRNNFKIEKIKLCLNFWLKEMFNINRYINLLCRCKLIYFKF